MRILICGSRNFGDLQLMREVINDLSTYELVIVHGDCRGADKLAARVAQERGLVVEAWPADWKQYGRAAGPIRNIAMLDSGIDEVIAFPVGESRGTEHTLREARKRGIARTIWREGSDND